MQIFARPNLLDNRPPDGPAVLLEGSWPPGADGPRTAALDDALDGRFAWIDREAEALCRRLIAWDAGGDGGTAERVSPFYLNALELRYWLVKLLRPLAYFLDVRRIRRGERLELIATRGRDRDYESLLWQLAAAQDAALSVRWVDAPRTPPGTVPFGTPAGDVARRWAGRLLQAGGLSPSAPHSGHPRQPRVFVCGNPRLLDPVCQALLDRSCHVWWLYDRFAWRAWRRWAPRGVRQLLCESSRGRANRLTARLPATFRFRGLELLPAVAGWIETRLAEHGARQTRIVEQMAEHFRRLRPDALVLDEDATPLARAAVSAAQGQDARSWVVQHGAPCCPFGYAPLAADGLFAWGQSSGDQLARWGVPPERIVVAGSPYHDQLRAALANLARRGESRESRHSERSEESGVTEGKILRCAQDDFEREFPGRPVRVLLLMTIMPRDDRPDALALQLTRHNYTTVLQNALDAVADFAQAELTVKLHPRSGDDPLLAALIAAHPSLRVRVVRQAPLESLLAEADVILAGGTSAGVDATLTGRPVIHLIPEGATEFLSGDPWGFAGVARTAGQLRQLLSEVLGPGAGVPYGPDPRALDCGGPAAERIVEAVLADAVQGHPRAGRRVDPPHAQDVVPVHYAQQANPSSGVLSS